MATIVLALGTSHSPQLSSPPEVWTQYGERDQRNPKLLGRDGGFHSYEELLELWPTVDPQELSEEKWRSKHARAQAAISLLAETLTSVAPDVLVVIGDDQEELFLDDGMPSFAVYWGDHVTDLPPSAERLERIPKDIQTGMWAYHGTESETYPTDPHLAEHIIRQLVLDEFDVTQLRRQPEGRTLGHAFTFVRHRLINGKVIPIVPVAVNVYYPPNQPGPRRCFMFGRALRHAIESWNVDARVAIVASGGLSHFVVDEELDHRVIDGMQSHDVESLITIPREYLQSGSSEILNWITLAGVIEHLSMELIDYIPSFRSPAGTGVGMTFARWT